MNYIQEHGLIYDLKAYVKGEKLLIVMSDFNTEKYQKIMDDVLDVEHEYIVYDKECSEANVKKIAAKMKKENFDSILGFGGGKVMDVVKAVSFYYDCFVGVMPTTASMDGAGTDVSVLYHEDHTFNRYLKLNKEPDVVLADSEIIFDAPFKFICSGMADALSTYFETKDYSIHEEVDEHALRMSHICLYNIIDNYDGVKMAYRQGKINVEVEDTIRTILNFSAQAFMKTGSSVAHAFANATTRFAKSKGSHGERVAVGLRLLLLLAENNWIEDVDLFLKRMDMPKTLTQLNLKEEDLDKLANYIKEEKSMCYAKEAYSIEEIRHALKMIL